MRKKLKDKYYISLNAKSSFTQLPEIMSWHYKELVKFLKENKIEQKSFFSTYSKTNLMKDTTFFESCAAEVSKRDYNKISKKKNIELILAKLESSEYICVKHTWDYKYLRNSWTAVYYYWKYLKYKMNNKAKSIEIYKKWSLDNAKLEEYETEILVPIK